MTPSKSSLNRAVRATERTLGGEAAAHHEAGGAACKGTDADGGR